MGQLCPDVFNQDPLNWVQLLLTFYDSSCSPPNSGLLSEKVYLQDLPVVITGLYSPFSAPAAY